MIDKSDFYHGAAIIRLLEDERCVSVRKLKSHGYIVNESIFICLKYTTKGRSPWGFIVDQQDVEYCGKMASEYKKIIFGFICDGDGICALSWDDVNLLLAGSSGRIAARRKHNYSYSVNGPAGKLKRKIAIGYWPALVFD